MLDPIRPHGLGIAQQYSDSQKLAARARINSKYTIAEVGWFPWVASQLPLQSGDRVLDLGCGPGWFWAATAKTWPERLDLTLADLSPGMVQEAVDRCRTLPLGSVQGQQADALALPFDEGSFDAVIAMHMLYHLPDPATGIAEMFSVLKPGGFLLVTTNGVGNMRKMYELTTVFGSPPYDPAAAAFGFDTAERLMRSQFGNVTMAQHPARLRITSRKTSSWPSRPIRRGMVPASLSSPNSAMRSPVHTSKEMLFLRSKRRLAFSSAGKRPNRPLLPGAGNR